MPSTDREVSREEMKEQLRAMVAGRGDGIDLDTPFHWVIKNLQQPAPFFEHLPELLPPDSIFYVEGTSIAPDVAAFYASHRARNAVDVARDTIAPIPDIYHFTVTSDVCRSLQQFATTRPVAELFDHIKAYHGETLLFTFHDAFTGWLLISEHLSQEKIDHFCRSLGVTCQREETKQRDLELLRRILWAFEHPDQVKINVARESWWRHWWRRLRGN